MIIDGQNHWDNLLEPDDSDTKTNLEGDTNPDNQNVNTITGVLRIRHTCMSFLVWVSTPLAASMTMITLSQVVCAGGAGV